MVNVDEKYKIKGAGGKAGVRLGSEHLDDVGQALGGGIPADTIEHAGLDVIGVYNAPRHYASGDTQAVESSARADVGDEHTWPEVERRESFLGLFFTLSLFAIKPIRATKAHHRSDAPSCDGMYGLRGGQLRGTHEDREKKRYGVLLLRLATRVSHSLRFRFGWGKLDAKKHIGSEGRGYDGAAQRRVPVCAALLVLALGRASFCPAADSRLAIVNAGVQQSEDAPFVPPSFRFLPGDSLYFSFGISGFAVQSLERGETRKISLRYKVTAEDSSGVPLTGANNGSIETELSPEDKNWIPKRRASFVLPPFVAAGEFRIHVWASTLR